MDGDKFKQWLKWWYSEVNTVSNGPRLLILDNCGVHDASLQMEVVRIEFITVNEAVGGTPVCESKSRNHHQ